MTDDTDYPHVRLVHRYDPTRIEAPERAANMREWHEAFHLAYGTDAGHDNPPAYIGTSDFRP